MDMPSEWIALVYKEIIADEQEKYKVIASFMGVDITGGKKKNDKLINRPPMAKEIASMGFGHKKGK